MSVAKLIYGDYTPGASDDAEISTASQIDFSVPSNLTESITSTRKLATLEHNIWVLDGTSVIKEDNERVVFWSNELSGEDCTFTTNPSITISFDNIYTSTGITIFFEHSSEEICSELLVTWYRDNTAIDSHTFYPTKVESFLEYAVENYNGIKIEFIKTKLPYKRVKLDAIHFGTLREFDRGMLRGVTIHHDCDPISQAASIAELSCELDDKENTTYIFQNKQPLQAYDGDTLIGVYYITSVDRHNSNRYTLTAEDVLGLLEKDVFDGAKYSNTSVTTVLDSIIDSDFEYELDPQYASATLTGYIPADVTCREALRQVCFALTASIITMGTKKIRIIPMQTTSTSTLTNHEIYTGDKVTTKDKVTHFVLYSHQLTQDSSGSIVIGGVTYRDDTTTKTIVNPDILTTDSINVVEIKDMTLINPSNLDNVAQIVYNYITRREQYAGSIVVGEHKVGDCVTVPTQWDTQIVGNITAMTIRLSNLTAADIEVLAE